MAQDQFASVVLFQGIGMHPRLEAVMQEIAPPSPVRVPSDPLQPVSGFLVRSAVDVASRVAAQRSYKAKASSFLLRIKVGNQALTPVSGEAVMALDITASKLRNRRRTTRKV